MTTQGDEEQENEEMKSLGTKVSPDFKTKVRILAGSKDESMSEYVRRAVEKQVEEDLEEGNSHSPTPLMITN